MLTDTDETIHHPLGSQPDTLFTFHWV